MAYGKEVGRISIRVLPNATKLRFDLQKQIERIQRQLKIELEVTAKTTKAKLDVQKFVDEYDGRDIDMVVQASTDVARAQIALLTRTREVSILARVRKASIDKANATFLQLTGARVAANLVGDLNNALGNLDQNVGKISRVSLGISSLTTTLLTASAGAITLGGDLLKIANVGLTLPAIAVGAAVGIATLGIALGDAKTQLASLQPAWESVRDTIRANFWEQAKQPILDFVNNTLPAMRDGFGSTAEAIGRQTGTLAAAFQRTLGGGVLEGLFGKLVESINIVTTGMNPLAEAFTTLGVVGSTYLPKLATYLVEVGTKFNEWVQSSTNSGEIFDFIDDGIQQLKYLGSAIAGISGIFRGLNSAAEAAGFGGLQSFAAAMQGAAAIIKSPEVQGALTTILSGAGTAFDNLGMGMSNLGKTLVVLAPTIGTVLAVAGQTIGSFVSAIARALEQPAVKDGLLALFDGISKGAKGLEPGLAPLAELFGTLATVVGAMAAEFGPILANLKITFAPLLESILQAVLPLIPAFGEAFVGALQKLAPIIEQVAGFIDENQGAITALIGVLATVGGATALAVSGFTALGKAGDVASGAMKGVKLAQSGLDTARLVGMYGRDAVKAFTASTAAMVKNKAETVALKAMYAADWLKSTVSSIAKATAEWAKNTAALVANKAKAAAVKAADLASSIATTTAAIAAQGAAWVRTTAAMVASKAVMVAQKVATVASTAAQWLLNAALSANPIGIIITLIAALVAGLIYFFTQTELGQQVWANITEFIGNAIQTIQDVIGAVVAWIAANWQLLLAIFLGPIGALIGYVITNFDSIVAYINGFIANVVTLWNAFWSGLGAIVGAIWSVIVLVVQTYIALLVAVITAVVSVITTAWNAFWTGLGQIVTIVWNAILSFVGTVVAAVASVITTAVSAIQAFWSSVWQAIVNVVTTVFGAIVSVVTSAINTARTIIANVLGIIQAVWSGNWSAIGSYVQNILNAARSFIASVLNAIISVIRSVMASATSVWNSAWNGISSVVSSVTGAIRSVVSGLVSSVSSAISGVGQVFAGIRSTITGALSGAASWLVASGRSIIEGLAQGIRNAVGVATSAISGVLDSVRNFLPFSPAKEGPFSGKGWTLYSGRSIGQALADGMTDRTSAVRSAAEDMMRAASGTAQIDLAGTNTSIDAARAASLAAGVPDYITINGGVGYDPESIAREISIKKRQAAMAAGLSRVQVA